MFLSQAIRVLRSGGLVIYPTETAYALGCDARNQSAVRQIYQLKGRHRGKPLAVIAADFRMVKRYFRLPTKPTKGRLPDRPSNFNDQGVGAAHRLTLQAARLTARCWPGPLTLVLPAKNQLMIKAMGRKQIGVRVSSNKIAARLSHGLGAPLVATSANRSGGGNCYTVRRALGSLDIRKPKIENRKSKKELQLPASRFQIIVINAGLLPRRRPSTVVGFRRGRPVVLRKGPVTIGGRT